MPRYKSYKSHPDNCSYEYNVSTLDEHRPYQQDRRTNHDLTPEHSSISMSLCHQDVRTDSDSRLTFYCNRRPSNNSYNGHVGENVLFSQENKNTYFNQIGRDGPSVSREQMQASQKRKRLARRSPSYSEENLQTIPMKGRQDSPFYSEDELFPLSNNIQQDSSSFSEDDVFSPLYNKKRSSPSFSFKNVCSSHISTRQALPSFSKECIDAPTLAGSPYGIVRDKARMIPQRSSRASIGEDEDVSESSFNSYFNMFDGNHNHGESGDGEPMFDQLILVEGQEIPDPAIEDIQCVLEKEGTTRKRRKRGDASLPTAKPSKQGLFQFEAGDSKASSILNETKVKQKESVYETSQKVAGRRTQKKRRYVGYTKSTCSESSEDADSKKPKKRTQTSINTQQNTKQHQNASDSTKSQSEEDGKATRIIQSKKPTEQSKADQSKADQSKADQSKADQSKADRKRRSKLTTSRSYERQMSNGTKHTTIAPNKEVDMSAYGCFQSYQFYILMMSIPIAWLAVKMFATFNNADFIIEPLFWFGDVAYMRTRLAPKNQCRSSQTHSYLERQQLVSEKGHYISGKYVESEPQTERATGPDPTSTEASPSTPLNTKHGQIHVNPNKELKDKQPRYTASFQNNVVVNTKQAIKSHGEDKSDHKLLSEPGPNYNEDALQDLANLGLGDIIDTPLVNKDTRDTISKVPTAYSSLDNPQTERVYEQMDRFSDSSQSEGSNAIRIKYEDQRFEEPKAAQKVSEKVREANHEHYIKYETLDLIEKPQPPPRDSRFTGENTVSNIDGGNRPAGESIPRTTETSIQSAPTLHHRLASHETDIKDPVKAPITDNNAAESNNIRDVKMEKSSEVDHKDTTEEGAAADMEAHHKKCRWGPSFFFKSCLF